MIDGSDKVKDFLVDWIIHFIRNKDIIARKILTIEKDVEGFDVKVTFSDKPQFFLAALNLRDMNGILHKFTNEGHYGIVTFNMKENVESLIKNWDKLIGFKFLSIYFINPWSNLDKKWIIYPYTHHRICDESSLAQGLYSMAELVEWLTEGEIKERIGD